MYQQISCPPPPQAASLPEKTDPVKEAAATEQYTPPPPPLTALLPVKVVPDSVTIAESDIEMAPCGAHRHLQRHDGQGKASQRGISIKVSPFLQEQHVRIIVHCAPHEESLPPDGSTVNEETRRVLEDSSLGKISAMLPHSELCVPRVDTFRVMSEKGAITTVKGLDMTPFPQLPRTNAFWGYSYVKA